MPTLIERLTGRKSKSSEVPVCPEHDVPMLLRGKLGRPARFHDQTASEYTLIYFCPVQDCANQEMRDVVRNQAAVPGAQPDRPTYARRND